MPVLSSFILDAAVNKKEIKKIKLSIDKNNIIKVRS